MNEDLTRQLLRRIAALERRLGIVETSEAGAAHSHSSYLNRDGSVALTADWDIGDGRKIIADAIRARDAAGLSLQDDGGNLGVFVADGGNVGIGTTEPGKALDVTGDINVSTGNLYSAGNIFRLWSGAAAQSMRTLGIQVSTSYSGDIPNNGILFGTDTNLYRGTANYLYTDDSLRVGGNLGIGAATPQGKLHVDQSSTTAAVPVLILDQADLSEEFIEFTGTVGTGNSIEAVGGKTLTTTHFIRINITGVGYRYIPVGTIA